jgi:four helix bundle suffix protein
VARASLEELRLDYEDFLRQRELTQWPPDEPALVRFKARRCTSLEDVQNWVWEEQRRTRTVRGEQGQMNRRTKSLSVDQSRCLSLTTAELAANGALSLLNLCCYLLDRQLTAQAAAFEREGGFTERLHRVRTARRGGAT